MADLPGRAWMDGDGRHVWWEHQCIDGIHRDMLPWPDWKAVDGKVSPSIVCTRKGCGHHSVPKIETPPDDWTPRTPRDVLDSTAGQKS